MPRLVDVIEAVLTNLVRPAKLLRVHQPQQHHKIVDQTTMPTSGRRATVSIKEKALLDPMRHLSKPQLLPGNATGSRTTSTTRMWVILTFLPTRRFRAHV